MNMQSRLAAIVAIIAAILALAAATTRFAQIDEGTRGIVVTQGAVEGMQSVLQTICAVHAYRDCQRSSSVPPNRTECCE